MALHRHIIRPIPGIFLCAAITVAAFAAERIECLFELEQDAERDPE